MSYDIASDAAKFFSNERCAELYTLDAEGTQYAINERPLESGSVRLGLVCNKPGKYHIAATRMDNPMILVDELQGISHDLSLGEYEFDAVAGTNNQRFWLKVSEDYTTSIEDIIQKTGVSITLDGGITISNLADDVNVSVYAANGTKVAHQQGNGRIALHQGTYVLRLGNMSTKIMVK